MPRTTEHIVGEIRQALEGTTPGPWEWVPDENGIPELWAGSTPALNNAANWAFPTVAPGLLARAADRIEQLEAQLRAAIPDGHDGDGSGGERNTGAVVVPPEGEPEGEPIR